MLMFLTSKCCLHFLSQNNLQSNGTNCLNYSECCISVWEYQDRSSSGVSCHGYISISRAMVVYTNQVSGALCFNELNDFIHCANANEYSLFKITPWFQRILFNGGFFFLKMCFIYLNIKHFHLRFPRVGLVLVKYSQSTALER